MRYPQLGVVRVQPPRGTGITLHRIGIARGEVINSPRYRKPMRHKPQRFQHKGTPNAVPLDVLRYRQQHN